MSEALGPLLKGREPKSVEGIRIVDAACGSGSFLLGAYDYLMKWYLDAYVADDAEKHARGRPPRLYRSVSGAWQLTTSERKRILLTHIFGVDIDLQAVEVTKLSLLLRVLEGESAESLGKSFHMFQERALPDLDANIKSGNSLVATDFFKDRSRPPQEVQFSVNAFDWRKEFPQAFQDGGFDAVIGNPPYVDSEWMTKTNPGLREYCVGHYNAARGNWDLFCVFVEKGLELCKAGGFTSMIVPNKLISADYAQSLRSHISTTATLLKIRDYSKVKVFPVSVYPVVYVCAKRAAKRDATVTYETMRETEGSPVIAATNDLAVHVLGTSGEWAPLIQGSDGDLVSKIARQGAPLGTIATVNGAATVTEAYLLPPLLDEWSKGCGKHLKFLNTGTVDRFVSLWAHFPTRYLKKSYTKPIIGEDKWRRLPAKRRIEAESEKIIIGGMTKVLECVLDGGTTLAGKSTTVVLNSSYPLKYVLGILNSRLMTYFFHKRFSGLALQGGFYRIGPPQVGLFPIPDPSRAATKARQLESFVDEIQELSTSFWNARTVHEKTLIERQLPALEAKIDRVVYQLFSLTPTEIAAVESI